MAADGIARLERVYVPPAPHSNYYSRLVIRHKFIVKFNPKQNVGVLMHFLALLTGSITFIDLGRAWCIGCFSLIPGASFGVRVCECGVGSHAAFSQSGHEWV